MSKMFCEPGKERECEILKSRGLKKASNPPKGRPAGGEGSWTGGPRKFNVHRGTKEEEKMGRRNNVRGGRTCVHEELSSSEEET